MKPQNMQAKLLTIVFSILSCATLSSQDYYPQNFDSYPFSNYFDDSSNCCYDDNPYQNNDPNGSQDPSCSCQLYSYPRPSCEPPPRPRKINPADPCCVTPLMGVDLGADFIIWQPCIDDLDFAGIYTTEVLGDDVTINSHHVRYRGLHPDWSPGVRVGFKINGCCGDWFVTGAYTWVKTLGVRKLRADIQENTFILSPLLHANFGFLREEYQFAKASWFSRYQTGDMLVGYDMVGANGNGFSPFFGPTSLFLNFDFDARYETIRKQLDHSAFFDWGSSYWGAGLKAGLDYKYECSEVLYLFGKASGMIVAGQATTGQDQRIFHDHAKEVTRHSFHDDKDFLVLPGYHVQFGIYLANRCANLGFGLRLGYEFLQWSNVPNHRSFAGSEQVDVATSTSPSTRTLGYQGFFAGIGVGF